MFLVFFGDRTDVSTPGMFTCGDRWSSDWFMIILSSIVVKRPDLGDTKSCTLSSIVVKRPDLGDTKSCTLSSIRVKRPDFGDGDTKLCTLSYLDVVCRYDIHSSQPKYL